MGRKIILGIPGLWPTRTDFIRAVVEHADGWIFAGLLLMEVATQESYELHVQEHDPRLVRAFEIAGQGRIPAETLTRIGEHRHVLYLLHDGGSIARARSVARAASALLRAGGIAVKVESAGVAHTGEGWDELTKSDELSWLYAAYVTLVGGDDVYYSCGMHQFGFPDAAAPRSLPVDAAAALMNHFNLYQLAESPTLADGHTFSVGRDAPRYRLQRRPCSFYPAGDPFHNEDGVWHLEPA